MVVAVETLKGWHKKAQVLSKKILTWDWSTILRLCISGSGAIRKWKKVQVMR